MTYQLPLGITLCLLGAFFYAAQTALIKATAISLPPLPIIIFIQSVVALLLILPIIFKNGRKNAKKLLQTQKIKLHLIRTLFSLSISFLLFYAVTFIPLVNGMLLANTAPLMIPFLGYFFFSHRINHRLWIPLLMGYGGIILVLHPEGQGFHPASLLALGAALCMASTMLLVRKLSATEATKTTAFYFFLFSSLISGLIAIPFWHPFSLQAFAIMISIGILYFSVQMLTMASLRYISAQLGGSLFYSTIVYATLLSFIIWQITPALPTLAGMVLIIVGGILCIRVERAHVKRLLAETTQEELTYAK